MFCRTQKFSTQLLNKSTLWCVFLFKRLCETRAINAAGVSCNLLQINMHHRVQILHYKGTDRQMLDLPFSFIRKDAAQHPRQPLASFPILP